MSGQHAMPRLCADMSSFAFQYHLRRIQRGRRWLRNRGAALADPVEPHIDSFVDSPEQPGLPVAEEALDGIFDSAPPVEQP